MANPLYYCKKGCLTLGIKEIFQNIELYIYPEDCICLIGKNGQGKSTLLKTILEIIELDSGEIYKEPNLTIDYLQQDIPVLTGTVMEYFLKNKIEEKDLQYYLDIFTLDLNIDLAKASGGEKRKVLLIEKFLKNPKILLLDEPTNHLDILAIEQLEILIKNYNGSIVCISHDKSFLENVTNKLFWIDRGKLINFNKGYRYFEDFQENYYIQEERELKKMQKKMEYEEGWLHGGISARRKRNQKRLSALYSLRNSLQHKKSLLSTSKRKVLLEIDNEKKSKFIVEFSNVYLSFGQKTIVENVSFLVEKGEKIAIVGPNGSGKTTLIQLMLGKIQANSGAVDLSPYIEVSYFDQGQESFQEDVTIKNYLSPTGSDFLYFENRTMHIAAYLKNFLFDPKVMHDSVKKLSGGEKNRLALAKILIKPGNVLILDEPTNDLDMETIDLLIEVLSDYKGTLIVSSHDRFFIDQIATRTFVLSNGRFLDSYGSYSDYKSFIEKPIEIIQKKKEPKKQKPLNEKDLMKEILALERSILQKKDKLNEQDLYNKDVNLFTSLLKELENEEKILEDLNKKFLDL